MANSRLEERVTRAAEATLAEQNYVSAIDVLLRLGWLAPSHLALWRQGRVECLERVVQASLAKQSTAMRRLHTWATQRGLTPSEAAYMARTRDRGHCIGKIKPAPLAASVAAQRPCARPPL